jgi:hypothetical protein
MEFRSSVFLGENGDLTLFENVILEWEVPESKAPKTFF